MKFLKSFNQLCFISLGMSFFQFYCTIWLISIKIGVTVFPIDCFTHPYWLYGTQNTQIKTIPAVYKKIFQI